MATRKKTTKSASSKSARKTDNAPLLVEIGTEELPPRSLKKLSTALTQILFEKFTDAGLMTGNNQLPLAYATPRRLAVYFPRVLSRQSDHETFRKGPAIKSAYDSDGNATQAVLGFARSLKVTHESLEQRDGHVGLTIKTKGQLARDLVPDILATAVRQLPIAKRMRWGDLDAEFVRPVHWLVLLHGKNIIHTDLLSVKSGRYTYGHRFHHPKAIRLTEAAGYEKRLKQPGYVIASFEKRRDKIEKSVLSLAAKHGGRVIMNESLLDEVTSLVEWPQAVLGSFDKSYLEVPQEALITTMQDNQKYFPVVNRKGKLLPYFITVSNIQSKQKARIREGNERVLNARLADARFFWQQDKKAPLSSYVNRLGTIVFHNKLGTVADKSDRVSLLAASIARETGALPENVERASLLAKADLMTGMVFEFPNLQGIMGRYYALHNGENEEVAAALEEQYLPRYAGDELPVTSTGKTLALADRVDSLAGIFAIGELPTGEKDPFGLRRAALGVLRILIEQGINLNIMTYLRSAVSAYPDKYDASRVALLVYDFLMTRLRAYYQDKGIESDVFEAVLSCRPNKPYDFDCRIKAVKAFLKLKEAESLTAANKRISNILKQADKGQWGDVTADLLREPSERALYEQLVTVEKEVAPLMERQEYSEAMRILARLRPAVDMFFDHVMVMVDDAPVRENRLSLLARMSNLFLRIADLSRLQG